MNQTIGIDAPAPVGMRGDPTKTLLILVDRGNELCSRDGLRYLGPEVGRAARASARAACVRGR